ncbi:uncharacterized protein LOC123300093 [Chrysoperla carnea]|uniref:uncharacterized protein LOC123300093 n=1 Tax=Chrysoperla carnea TaxID=189513 RepID=UPI001D0631FA|nr:uncharacterized protein LOC123300093 [Chrysoperla carnea]
MDFVKKNLALIIMSVDMIIELMEEYGQKHGRDTPIFILSSDVDMFIGTMLGMLNLGESMEPLVMLISIAAHREGEPGDPKTVGQVINACRKVICNMDLLLQFERASNIIPVDGIQRG